MKNYLTLKQYISQLTTILGLPNTSAEQKKIQKKFERTLKNDLKVWDSAETIKIAKTQAKIFPLSILDKAYQLNNDYLAKIIKLDTEELKHQIEYNNWLLNQNTIISKEEFEQTPKILNSANEHYEKNYKISLEEQNNVMLKALFEKFFTPLDIKRWENDKIIIANTQNVNDLNYLAAQQRLDVPDGKSYFKEK